MYRLSAVFVCSRRQDDRPLVRPTIFTNPFNQVKPQVHLFIIIISKNKKQLLVYNSHCDTHTLKLYIRSDVATTATTALQKDPAKIERRHAGSRLPASGISKKTVLF